MRLIKSAIAIITALTMSTAVIAADKGVAVVAGATGQTGRPLVKILKEQGYTVRAMVRGDTTAAELGADEVVKADVTQHDTLPPAVKGADYVFSVVGTGSGRVDPDPEAVDYKGVAALVDAAKAAGAKQFVLISAVRAGNADPNFPINKSRKMVMMWKGKGEDHLRASGLPYTIVRPGPLENCGAGTMAIQVADAGVPLGSGALCRDDVAEIMAASLNNPDALNKTFGIVRDEAGGDPDSWKTALKQIKKDR